MIDYKDRVKPDYEIIESLVDKGSRVLDLGCGDGSLLQALITNRQVTGMGVDNFPEGLNQCLKKGLSVLQLDLNQGLSTFRDKSFDYVILNMTLQAMVNPLLLIKEMVRVGKKAIVGFPNFGHWKLVSRLLLKQRMPKTKTLPYEWYNTPNIRLMTVKDFRVLCAENQIRRLKETFLGENGQEISGPLLNYRAIEGVFLLQGSE